MTLENEELNIVELVTADDVQKCRAEVEVLKKERKYNAVMERIISLFNAGHTDADLMLDLAQIYYDTQDYARAENWAKNAFNKDGDLEAQILLSKIYSDDNKIDKMAETLNLALVNSKDKFNKEQLKTIDDLLFYIELSFEENEIADKYPNTVKWINQDGIIDIAEDNIEESNEQITESGRENIIEPEMIKAHDSILPCGDIRSNKTVFELQAVVHKAVEGSIINEEEIYFLQNCMVNEVINEVEKLPISLQKKILMYNFMASIYYQAGKLENAVVLLKAALAIDDENEIILKNLGFVFYKQGDKQNAKIVLNAIANKDFMVCELLEDAE